MKKGVYQSEQREGPSSRAYGCILNEKIVANKERVVSTSVLKSSAPDPKAKKGPSDMNR